MTAIRIEVSIAEAPRRLQPGEVVRFHVKKNQTSPRSFDSALARRKPFQVDAEFLAIARKVGQIFIAEGRIDEDGRIRS